MDAEYRESSVWNVGWPLIGDESLKRVLLSQDLPRRDDLRELRRRRILVLQTLNVERHHRRRSRLPVVRSATFRNVPQRSATFRNVPQRSATFRDHPLYRRTKLSGSCNDIASKKMTFTSIARVYSVCLSLESRCINRLRTC